MNELLFSGTAGKTACKTACRTAAGLPEDGVCEVLALMLRHVLSGSMFLQKQEEKPDPPLTSVGIQTSNSSVRPAALIISLMSQSQSVLMCSGSVKPGCSAVSAS